MENRIPPYIEDVVLLDHSKPSYTLLNTAQRELRLAETAYKNTSCSNPVDLGKGMMSAIMAGKYFATLLSDVAIKGHEYEKNVQGMLDFAIFYKEHLDHKSKTCEIARHDAENDIGLAGSDADAPTYTPDEIKLRNKILSAFILPKCGKFRGFDEYAGGHHFKQIFENMAVLPFNFANFSKEHLQGILLFGPPGTGKSRLAEAVAAEVSELKSSFISISASDLNDKYLGESEKSISTLFTVAREYTHGGSRPCIVFIDEIDGVINKDAGGNTSILSEINRQMQGVSNASNRGLIIIAATNYPSKIPAAALSRFQNGLIYVGLPDLDTIKQKLLLSLKHFPINRKNTDFGQWVEVDEESTAGKKEVQRSGVKFNFAPANLILDKIFDQKYEVVNNANQDPKGIDLLTLKLYNENYSNRDIDSVFHHVGQASMRAAYDFYKQWDEQLTSIEPNSSERAIWQTWLLDKTQFRVKKQDKNGKCVEEIAARHALIPINVFNASNGKEIEQFGYYDPGPVGLPILESEKGITLVTTKKTMDPATGVYKIVFHSKYDKTKAGREAWVPYNPYKEEEVDMLYLLGHKQVTVQEVIMAIETVKPGRIDMIPQLIDFIRSSGQIQGTESIKQITSRLEQVESRQLTRAEDDEDDTYEAPNHNSTSSIGFTSQPLDATSIPSTNPSSKGFTSQPLDPKFVPNPLTNTKPTTSSTNTNPTTNASLTSVKTEDSKTTTNNTDRAEQGWGSRLYDLSGIDYGIQAGKGIVAGVGQGLAVAKEMVLGTGYSDVPSAVDENADDLIDVTKF